MTQTTRQHESAAAAPPAIMNTIIWRQRQIFSAFFFFSPSRCLKKQERGSWCDKWQVRAICDRRKGTVCDVWHLAWHQAPPPSPRHPPGHLFESARSAGDTRQTLDLLSAQSASPETGEGDERVCETNSWSGSNCEGGWKDEGTQREENEVE